MAYPNDFISNSDYASTPAPLEGAKKIDLTTPASVPVGALEVVEFSESVQFDKDFDAVEYIITCDEFPELVAINWSYSEYADADLFVSVSITGKRVSLVAVFTNFHASTFVGERHFHAVVVPIKSPFEQS